MTILIGLIIAGASLIGGFAALGGKVSVLWQPWELVIILGVAIGAFVVANPMKVIKGTLVAVSLMMAIPALLIAATLYLPAAICRWSNIVFGLLYTAIMAITLPGAAPFYITLAVIEMALTAAIVIAAWTWATAEGGSE